MKTTKHRSGNVTVTLRDRTDELARLGVARATANVLRRVTDEMKAIQGGARRRWPVGATRKDRGGRHSRDELVWRVMSTKSGVTGRVLCLAPWGRFVRQGRDSAFYRFLRKPLLEGRAELLDDIAAATVAGLEGR